MFVFHLLFRVLLFRVSEGTPKGNENDPKWIQKGIQNGSQKRSRRRISKTDLWNSDPNRTRSRSRSRTRNSKAKIALELEVELELDFRTPSLAELPLPFFSGSLRRGQLRTSTARRAAAEGRGKIRLRPSHQTVSQPTAQPPAPFCAGCQTILLFSTKNSFYTAQTSTHSIRTAH